MVTEISRRDFLGALSGAACSVHWEGREALAPPARATYQGTLCLFSKPLPDMDWERLAQAGERVGFGGIDLTVRPGGHVRPERAAQDLPRAVSTIRCRGTGSSDDHNGTYFGG
jgi:L-ribulose-5-phosphate 3-epimerase